MSKILFTPCSLRAASSLWAAIRALTDHLVGKADCGVAEIGKLPHYDADIVDDPEASTFIEQVAEADALIFVTPE